MQTAIVISDRSVREASSERSFSKLKIISLILEVLWVQECLGVQTLISIGNKEITETLKEKVINHFAFGNARMKNRFS